MAGLGPVVIQRHLIGEAAVFGDIELVLRRDEVGEVVDVELGEASSSVARAGRVAGVEGDFSRRSP